MNNSKSMENSHWLFIAALILIGVFSRWIPHPGNFTAVGAVALLAGSVLRLRGVSLLLPLFILFLSDLVLGYQSISIFVYGAFMISVLIGHWIPAKNYFQKDQVLKIGGATISSSFVFFLITNFGVWFDGGIYSQTFKGLLECYMMGLPFLKNQILGDLFFSGVLFSSYELLGRRWLFHRQGMPAKIYADNDVKRPSL